MPHLRSALRNLVHAPYLSAVVILSLAIGIGANTLVSSWLRQALFEPLPGVTQPVLLLEVRDDMGNYSGTNWPEYRDLPGLLPSVSGIAAHRLRALYLGDSERDSRIFAEYVSGNFFPLLGVRPALGRFFVPEEVAQPGSAAVVVISHAFWQHHFQGAPDVLGRPLKLNGVAFTIVGVTPPEFRGAYNTLGFDVWVPLTMAEALQPATLELRSRLHRSYHLLVQLRPGVPPAQVQAELAHAARKFSDINRSAETNRDITFELLPLWRSPRSGTILAGSLATLQIFALLILIVVGVNTANLLLARATTRRREIGVRLALGAGARQILAQLLTESVGLALLGAGLGLLFAVWGVDLLQQMPVPSSLPVRISPPLDWFSLLFATGLGTACGILFGLAPALQLARGDVLESLRGGRGLAGGRSRLRDLLVGAEMAVALLVLVLAGLFLKSFRNAQKFDTGYDAERVLLANLDLAGRGYDQQSGMTLLNNLLPRLAALPGIEAVSAAGAVPLDIRGLPTGNIYVEGRPYDPKNPEWIIWFNTAPGYFTTLGLPLVDGRDLSPLERADLPLDAVINEEMARRCWPGVSPIGRRFEIGGTFYTVAGVVRNAKYVALNEAPRPVAWLTLRAQFIFSPTLHLRAASGSPAALLPAVRAAVRGLDAGLTLADTRTLARHIDNNLILQRAPARMLAVLGPLALALAAIGLYAVIAYSLGQRVQEIGVRLALGATPRTVVRMMLWQGLRVVLVGAAVGFALSLVASYLLQKVLVGVPFGDPVIFAGIPALLLGVALLASWLPARRAARVDPLIALRAE
ncbi:MAG: hypothetical protein C0502_06995 [Opitutus sp.]|nr:hypothetical protein [Opitutus sp.]